MSLISSIDFVISYLHVRTKDGATSVASDRIICERSWHVLNSFKRCIAAKDGISFKIRDCESTRVS